MNRRREPHGMECFRFAPRPASERFSFPPPLCIIATDDPKEVTDNLLVFHLGGQDCAFPLDAVREIAPMATLSSPPGLPSGLAGFLNLRGTAIPVVRLDRLFGLPELSPGLHTPMIILRGGAAPIGVLVESVRAIVPVPPGQLLDLSADRTFRGCATAALRLNGDLIHILSPAAILDANEDRLLADYGAMSRARLLHLERRREIEPRIAGPGL
jgi:purine-binding chemotaxis protein CheW